MTIVETKFAEERMVMIETVFAQKPGASGGFGGCKPGASGGFGGYKPGASGGFGGYMPGASGGFGG
jgi:hypothetical protein